MYRSSEYQSLKQKTKRKILNIFLPAKKFFQIEANKKIQ